MIPRKAPRLLSTLIPSSTVSASPLRCLHTTPSRIPKPTPFVPDPSTFLTLIGRNMTAHASKIPSWDALFTLSSQQLRDSGLEPARSRRYLLRWREEFRNGEFGIGGDLTDVVDGRAELVVAEIADPSVGGEASLSHTPGKRRVVVNVAPGTEGEALGRVVEEVQRGSVLPVEGVRIKGLGTIAGQNVRLLKGGRAEITVQEGLWEHRRGRKVDGGERRKAEVRAKRRAAERKTT